MISQQLSKVIEVLNLELREDISKYSGICPIHENANNKTALNIMKHGRRWCCYTHQCEKHFQKNFIGFVRALLSRKRFNWTPTSDKTVSYKDAQKFCEQIIGNKITEFDAGMDTGISNVYLNNTKPNGNIELDPGVLKTSLQYPCSYFLRRGFTEEILEKYDVGVCLTRGKRMYNRAVFPLFNSSKTKIIGCTGRSITEKCVKCGHFHPEGKYCNEFPKWRHAGFRREAELFNYWYAQEYIKQSKTAVLVESPNCVMKLESNGIRNSVAIMGTYLCPHQLSLLNRLGVMTLVIFRDADEAGLISSKDILEKCKDLYYLVFPKIEYHDITDCPNEYIKRIVVPIVEQYS